MNVTLEKFLEDVKGHTMDVRHGTDSYRHLVFSNNGSSNLKFEIVTFPWHLVYTGDMGTFVFRRLADMFDFFRPKDGTYRKEFGYWHSKLTAVCSSDGAIQKSRKRFEVALRGYLPDPPEPGDYGDDLSEKTREEINYEISRLLTLYDTYGFQRALQEACDFCVGPPERPLFQFSELWDHSFDEFTTRFEWCCWALQWGILLYDEWASKLPERLQAVTGE